MEMLGIGRDISGSIQSVGQGLQPCIMQPAIVVALTWKHDLDKFEQFLRKQLLTSITVSLV